MKKLKFAILLLAIFVCKSANAQTKVFIPDSNFRNFLTIRYPTFMDITGDSLIAYSVAILTGLLDCSYQNIANLKVLCHSAKADFYPFVLRTPGLKDMAQNEFTENNLFFFLPHKEKYIAK